MLRPLLLLASACAARAVPLSSTLLTLRDDVDALEAIIGADHERRRPESCEERMAGDHYEATNPRTSEKESLWTSLATRCETCVRNDGACQLCVKLSSWGDMKCLGKDSAGCDTSEGYALLDAAHAHTSLSLATVWHARTGGGVLPCHERKFASARTRGPRPGWQRGHR